MSEKINPGLYHCVWRLKGERCTNEFYNYHGENGKWYNGTDSIEDIIGMCQDQKTLFIGDVGVVDDGWELVSYRSLTSDEIKKFLM